MGGAGMMELLLATHVNGIKALGCWYEEMLPSCAQDEDTRMRATLAQSHEGVSSILNQ